MKISKPLVVVLLFLMLVMAVGCQAAPIINITSTTVLSGQAATQTTIPQGMASPASATPLTSSIATTVPSAVTATSFPPATTTWPVPSLTPTPFISATPSPTLTVLFMDVGQADCTIIQYGSQAMIIDAGGNSTASALVSSIKIKGIRKFDVVIGTHPHEDHIGGLDAVINNFDIGAIYMPKVSNNTQTFEDALTAIQKKGLSITTPVPGAIFKLGQSVECTILAPNGANYPNLNSYSIVTKMSYGQNSFLFTGDAETDSEAEMLAKGFNVQADVLKVGHHGSTSSTSPEFLKAVSPKIGIIFVGKDNTYGHPHQLTLDRLSGARVQVYRTDQNSTTKIGSDGFTLTVMDLVNPSLIPTKTSLIPIPTTPSIPPSAPVTPPTSSPATPATSPVRVQITRVFYDGLVPTVESDEYVEITNAGSTAVDLNGWTLLDMADGTPIFRFPPFLLQPGQIIRVYTNEVHPESGGFSFGSSKAIWNNSTPDIAGLLNAQGHEVSRKSY